MIGLKAKIICKWMIRDYNLPEDCTFIIDNYDDGMWSGHEFFHGCVTDKSGHKMHLSFENDDIEILWDE